MDKEKPTTETKEGAEEKAEEKELSPLEQKAQEYGIDSSRLELIPSILDKIKTGRTAETEIKIEDYLRQRKDYYNKKFAREIGKYSGPIDVLNKVPKIGKRAEKYLQDRIEETNKELDEDLGRSWRKLIR